MTRWIKEVPPVRHDGEQLFDERVQERERRLADNARISALDRLGENSRAVKILEAQLGR